MRTKEENREYQRRYSWAYRDTHPDYVIQERKRKNMKHLQKRLKEMGNKI